VLQAGVELIYVAKGKLALKVSSEEDFVVAADSLYFDALLPHGHSRVGNKVCSAVVAAAE
jgi:quercetin dioxygenase-like cupin family protein